MWHSTLGSDALELLRSPGRSRIRARSSAPQAHSESGKGASPSWLQALGRLVGRGTGKPDFSELPVWMDPMELAQLRAVVETLQPARVLEWGAGGSTRELLASCAFIRRYVSIEHDPHWHARVRERVRDPRLELHLVEASEPEPKIVRGTRAEREARSAWRSRAETDPELMRAYIQRPLGLGANGEPPEFDLVLIDGRARSQCVGVGAKLLRPGGVLVVHDAQRPEYHAALREVGRPVFLEPWRQGQICILRRA